MRGSLKRRESGGKEQANQSAKVLMHAFLSSLASCVSRDHCDKAAVRFATGLNSNANRTRLVRTLVTVPSNRLDLLPFYARSAASLSPIMPSVSQDVVTAVKQDLLCKFTLLQQSGRVISRCCLRQERQDRRV